MAGTSPKGAFLIVANMRCGTTWTQMMLGELEDVATDYEFKWAPPYAPYPQHMVIPDGSFSCKRALRILSSEAPIVGSKLVLDQVPLSDEEFNALARTVENDIVIVHITRNYAEVAQSFYRGFHHVLAQPAVPVFGIMQNALKDTTRAFQEYMARPDNERRRHVSLRQTATLFHTLLRNDLWAARLCCHNPYMRVRYDNVKTRFPEIARFVGSKESEGRLKEIVASPPTVKLPKERVLINQLQVSLLAMPFHILRRVGFLWIAAIRLLRKLNIGPKVTHEHIRHERV